MTDAPFTAAAGRIIAIDRPRHGARSARGDRRAGRRRRPASKSGTATATSFHPEREQVAHYFRFQELKLGRRYRSGDTPLSGPTGEPISVDWDGVRPMRRNPRTSDHAPGSPIRTAQEEFNHAYCALLHLLEQAFNGSPRLLAVATGSMYGLKAKAQALMLMPTEDGLGTAGPTFEYVAPRLSSVDKTAPAGNSKSPPSRE